VKRVVNAHPDDVPNWLALAAEVEPLFGPMVFDPDFHRALWKNLERGTALCVREDDGPPGALLLGGLLFGPTPPKYEIDWLAVAARSRHNGVGDALVQHLFGLVQPPAEIVLLTFAAGIPDGEPARRFYEKHGFQPAEPGPTNPAGYPTQVYRRLIGLPPTVRAVLQQEDRFLLVQHHYKNPVNTGKWSLPGGQIDASDFDRQAALHRELREEFQIDVDIVHFIDSYVFRERQHHIYLARPLQTDLNPDPAEIVAYEWFRLDEVRAIHANGALYAAFMLDAIVASQTHVPHR
jgi:8-oxo-dGTP pyrophosphatase MutT (NUDIX family)/ribosomal protein S18 acetylase RimI-like enzyme